MGKPLSMPLNRRPTDAPVCPECRYYLTEMWARHYRDYPYSHTYLAYACHNADQGYMQMMHVDAYQNMHTILACISVM
jgi:hypothetical protein